MSTEATHDKIEVQTTAINTLSESALCDILGTWYVNESGQSEIAQRAYDIIAQINEVWYGRIPVEIIWQEKDPYSCYSEMRERVEEEGVLRVFCGGSNPTFMTHEDNIKGRAVHDWFGHLERDCDFSLKGEWSKYMHVKHRYPAFVRPLLFTEIVGQRAAVGYLPGGFGDELFEQKPVMAPRHIRNLTTEVFR